MKKFVFLIFTIVLFVTGCGTKTGIIVCTSSTNDVINGYSLNSTYVINYKGNTVESVETEEVVASENNEVLSYFEKTLDETYSKLQDTYGGYQYNITNENGKVTSSVMIDYNKMNVEQMVKDQPSLKSYVSNDKLTVEGIKSMYKQLPLRSTTISQLR